MLTQYQPLGPWVLALVEVDSDTRDCEHPRRLASRNATLSRRKIAAPNRSGLFRDSLLRSHAFLCRSPKLVLAKWLIRLSWYSDYLATNQALDGSGGRAHVQDMRALVLGGVVVRNLLRRRSPEE